MNKNVKTVKNKLESIIKNIAENFNVERKIIIVCNRNYENYNTFEIVKEKD
ncbi:MAG: hypothetical protein JXM74_06355 [Fusobacteriaceae bacterium]|nr:hypothetical protein [Fusobacteriaceae bacterium]MBN2838361.1 hypothetical protein [Fusobacteriaceae bacterium]